MGTPMYADDADPVEGSVDHENLSRGEGPLPTTGGRAARLSRGSATVASVAGHTLSAWLTSSNAAVMGIKTMTAPHTRLLGNAEREGVTETNAQT